MKAVLYCSASTYGIYLEELQNLPVIETGSKGQHREREADHAL